MIVYGTLPGRLFTYLCGGEVKVVTLGFRPITSVWPSPQLIDTEWLSLVPGSWKLPVTRTPPDSLIEPSLLKPVGTRLPCWSNRSACKVRVGAVGATLTTF